MNEPFDVEISRALKASADTELQGWEFTPAMQAKVMERIRTGAGETTAAPSRRRADFAAIVRPVAWIAAAAAAVLVVVNVGLPSMGSSKKEMATSQAPAAEAMKTEAPAAPTAGTPTPGPTPEPQSKATSTADAVTTTIPASGATNQGFAASTAAAEPAPMAKTHAIALAVPAAPEDSAKALSAPEPPMGKMSLAAVSSNVAGAVTSNGAVVTLTPFGVRNDSGWERPLADLNPNSLLAMAADGRMAVANGGDLVYLLDNWGEHVGTLRSDGAIGQVLWSADGRIAWSEPGKVVVVDARSGKTQIALEAGMNSQIAFAPEGMLAVFGDRSPDSHQLTLVDAKGSVLAKAQPAVGGRGLAISADGQIVVAGGQAYDRTGTALWQSPLKTEGAAALGADRMLLWDAHTVMAVRAEDGGVIWQAEWQGSDSPGLGIVIASADGRQVAILGDTEAGPVLWVVSSEGKVILTDRLPQRPVDFSIVGEQIILILPDSVDHRAIPK